MKISKDKVRGTFIGCAIGDSLGMSVETFTHERILKDYGRVTQYIVPNGHKWFNGQPAGMITDDTQLTIAVAEAMIENGLDMEAQAKWHIEAMKETTKGWGRSTRQSIRNLSNNCHWSKSGAVGGAGNGTCMKISPLGLYAAKVIEDDEKLNEALNFVATLSMMTHKTSVATSSALAMTLGVYGCAVMDPESFNVEKWINLVTRASEFGRHFLPDTITDDISARLGDLHKYEEYDTERMIEEYGGGSCYCYNSLPFTFMHFVKNPLSIDCLYDVVTAGGDTDSNGSMVGSLLGALHGESIFPQELIDGLQEKDRILEVADRFHERFFG